MLSSKENKINSTGTPVSAFTYSVNPLNQRTSVQTSGTAFASQPANWAWGYDALGQVVSADSPTPAFDRAYQYDAIGNRTSSTDNTALTTYAANALNQYSQISPPSPSSPVVPLHDDDGNQIDAQIRPLGSSSLVSCVFHWDAENRIIAVQDKATEAVIVSYTYDSGSRRVARKQGTGTAVYLYDRWNSLAEYTLQNSSFTLQSSLTWGLDLAGSLQGAGGVGGLLAVTKNQDPSITHFFPTFDGNGNVSEYLSSNGTVATHFEYDPFGRTVAFNGPQSAEFEYRFSTKPLDDTTGRYYYGYRVYDPDAGRWINRDLIEEDGGVSLYGFVGNDGVAKIDVLGNNYVSSFVSARLGIPGVDDISGPERGFGGVNSFWIKLESNGVLDKATNTWVFTSVPLASPGLTVRTWYSSAITHSAGPTTWTDRSKAPCTECAFYELHRSFEGNVGPFPVPDWVPGDPPISWEEKLWVEICADGTARSGYFTKKLSAWKARGRGLWIIR